MKIICFASKKAYQPLYLNATVNLFQFILLSIQIMLKI